MTVVDASVAVKWFFPERGYRAAQELLTKDGELVAPALIRVEVFAAITRKVRLGEIAQDQARAACDLWRGALQKRVLELASDEDHLPLAVDLALMIGHPLQDCLYLAVAQREKGVLLTADPKFHARARAIYDAVQLLDGVLPQ